MQFAKSDINELTNSLFIIQGTHLSIKCRIGCQVCQTKRLNHCPEENVRVKDPILKARKTLTGESTINFWVVLKVSPDSRKIHNSLYVKAGK